MLISPGLIDSSLLSSGQPCTTRSLTYVRSLGYMAGHEPGVKGNVVHALNPNKCEWFRAAYDDAVLLYVRTPEST